MMTHETTTQLADGYEDRYEVTCTCRTYSHVGLFTTREAAEDNGWTHEVNANAFDDSFDKMKG